MRHYFPDAEIDVVDIDPEIPQVAKEFFGFSEDDKLKVHVDDGRMFIKKQLRRNPVPRYDIIILDAFNGDYIPFHLMTREFLQEVKGVVDDDGVVVANVFYSNRLFDAEFKTFLEVFERCQAFYGLDSGNAMLVSGGPSMSILSPKQAEERARQLAEKHDFAFDMVAVARRLDPDSTPDPDARVLTDDRAPVNWLRSQEKQTSP
jgi:spermidine synthase